MPLRHFPFIRDLRIFNQALVAREAWRLLTVPDSLCARVIKGKYFPAGNLWDTAFIRNSSPCWQGISHGLDLLKQGLIWRIGDGATVQIWRENWLPRGNLHVARPNTRSRVKRVSELILPDEGQWNIPLIRDVFYPFDVEEILKLRIPHIPCEDVLAWHYEKSEIFSVQSACRLGLNLKFNLSETSSRSHPDGQRALWKP